MGLPRDALEVKGPRRRPPRRLGRRLEEVAKAAAGGYCRLQMPVKLALGVRGTVAGHRLGALEGVPPPPFPMHPLACSFLVCLSANFFLSRHINSTCQAQHTRTTEQARLVVVVQPPVCVQGRSVRFLGATQ